MALAITNTDDYDMPDRNRDEGCCCRHVLYVTDALIVIRTQVVT
jgi:hypothetical protein